MVVRREIISPVFGKVVFEDGNDAFEKDLGIEFAPKAISSAGWRTNGEDNSVFDDL